MATSTTIDSPSRRATSLAEWARWEPLAGIAFVVLFVVALIMNNLPKDNASTRDWLNYYASSGNQVKLLLSGFLLVLASLCLLGFVTALWSRVVEARRPEGASPIPLVGAAMAAAGIALGGVMYASVPGAMIFGSLRLPSAEILRLTTDTAFPAIVVAGMFAVALVIVSLGLQASDAGMFGPRFAIVSLAVGVVTLFSFLFIPMVAPLIWFLAVSIILLRREAANLATPSPAGP